MNGTLLWVDDEIELLRPYIIFLEKKEYDEKFKPVYSDEELEEIEAQEMEEEENSWINDDDIDFDEYEDYYRED